MSRKRDAVQLVHNSRGSVHGRLVALLVLFCSGTVALAGAGTGAGQSRPGARPEPTIGDVPATRPQAPERELVLEREAYDYPAGARRNPFLPVDAVSGDVARFAGVRLLGIIHHPDPAYRIAVVSLREGSADFGTVEATVPGTVRRLRIGEELAGTRIVAIEADHVAVETEEPGGTATAVLAMPRADKGVGS